MDALNQEMPMSFDQNEGGGKKRQIRRDTNGSQCAAIDAYDFSYVSVNIPIVKKSMIYNPIRAG